MNRIKKSLVYNFFNASIILVLLTIPWGQFGVRADSTDISSEHDGVSAHLEFLDAPHINNPAKLQLTVSSPADFQGSALITLPEELELVEGELSVDGSAGPGENWQHVFTVVVNQVGEFKIHARIEGVNDRGVTLELETDLYLAVSDMMAIAGQLPVRIPQDPIISPPEDFYQGPQTQDWGESQPPNDLGINDSFAEEPLTIEDELGSEEAYQKPGMETADIEMMPVPEEGIDLPGLVNNKEVMVIADGPSEVRELNQDEPLSSGDDEIQNFESDQETPQSYFQGLVEGELLAGIDLIVQDIWSTTNPLHTSDWEDITFRIKNQGTDNAGQDFQSRLKFDSVYLTTWLTNGLDAGSTATASVNVLVKTGGSHQVQIEVDYTGAVTETNEGNNIRTETWSWTIAADLIVEDIWSTTTPLHTSDTENITFRIKNQGTGNIAHGFYARLRIDGGVITTWYASGLNAGGTALNEVDVIVPSGGSHQVEAAVDYTGLVAETNEANNVRTETWAWANAADLIVQDIWSTTNPLTTSEWENIIFRYKNQGTGNIDSTFYAILRINGGGIKTWLVNGMAPSTTATLSVDTIVGSPGTHQVQVEIDYSSQVGETNEGNNIRTENWNWIDAADLIVSDLWSTTTPLNSGEVEDITFRIKNQGTGGIGAEFSTRMWVDGGVIATLFFRGGLAAGATLLGNATTNVVSSGTHSVQAQVDYGGNVSETNEANNLRSETWIWTNAPDLIVEDIWSTTNPLKEGDSENITVRIKNEGAASTSSSFSTRLYVDGILQQTWVMAPLASGATITTSTAVLINQPFFHQVQVEVDFTAQVSEGDETNNIRLENWYWIPLPRVYLPLAHR